MGAHTYIFCFVLFTSAASLSIPAYYPEYSNGSLPEVAESQKCECPNGKCVTDNKGNTKCVCRPGYALQDEFTCKPCDCGSKGRCIFTLIPKSAGGFTYEKKCVCDIGSAEKDGKCIDCYCGDNSACEFNGEEKNCYCIDGYAEKDGACAKCDCGFYGKCEFKMGIKQCECDEGFLESNGICEECDCGDHGLCSFMDGAKHCRCDDGFQDNSGTCAECRCGENSVGCHFSDGFKTCDCKEKFSDKDGTCEKCDCGSDSLRCRYFKGEKTCLCAPGFVQKGDWCKVACGYGHPCENGGMCVGGYCSCLTGTRGEFCEVIDECDYLCPKQRGINCAYDAARKEPFCECLDHNLRYDPERKQCHKPCNEKEACRNGGICTSTGSTRFCRCLDGTDGDFCDEVPKCHNIDCGAEAECSYDVEEARAYCQCRDRQLLFDERVKRCKKICGVDSDCLNGGKCGGRFCNCLDGTSGDMCEIVSECYAKDCGSNATCVFSVYSKSAVCRCYDQKYSFDEVDRTCKERCIADVDCHNGGRCNQRGHDSFCDCLPGTGGNWCETVDDCNGDLTKCKGDASCVFDKRQLKGVCECSDNKKRYDTLREECKLTCYEDASCHNGGQCMHRGDHLFCECKVGTSGHLCETVKDCQSGLCGNRGDVDCLYDVTKETAVCKCRSPQHLFDPVSKTCKGCDCGKNSASCRFENGKKICVCRDGYEAKNEVCQKVKCTEKSCHNGKCQVVGDEEVCSCFEGYALDGDHCRKLNCSKTPCYNGTCVVRHGNMEECVCQDGYTLKNGVCIRGACRIDTCYGGYCDTIDGELLCVCPKNYSLQGIGCYATVCRKYHCFGGWCVVNENKEEICTCHDGYVLVNDVCKKILCTNPCFGGECKFVNGKEECICPPGYSIFKDVCRDNRVIRGNI